MSSRGLTANEIVAYLKNSTMPSIIVEGDEDKMVYRWILEDLGISSAFLQVCNGRSNLLEVFDRKNEFKHIPVLFIADKDTFVYTGVPEKYQEIVFTNGYSIENDLYYGRQIENLLSKKEDTSFRKALKNFIRYYGCMYERFSNGLEGEYSFRQHPNEILNENQDLNEGNVYHGFQEPTDKTKQYISEKYDVLLRGHSLFDLLVRFLSYSKRKPKHSKHSLCEDCYRLCTSEPMRSIKDKIRTFGEIYSSI